MDKANGKDAVTLVGTSSQAAKNKNQILLFGQWAVEKDSELIRIGDGRTPYFKLKPFTWSTINKALIDKWNGYEATITALQLVIGVQIDQTPTSGARGTLTGAVNGTNDTFIVSKGKYITGKLRVIMNGVEQVEGVDFTELVPNAGTFKFTTPPLDQTLTGTTIIAVY